MRTSLKTIVIVSCLALMAALPAAALAALTPQEAALKRTLTRGGQTEAFQAELIAAITGLVPVDRAALNRIFRTTDATVVANNSVNPTTARFACSNRYTIVMLYNRRTEGSLLALVKNGRLLGFEERAGSKDYGFVRGRCVNGRMSLRTLA